MALHLGTCPRCHGSVTLEEDGVISTVRLVNGVERRVGRPARFWACNHCEWCEEIIKGRW